MRAQDKIIIALAVLYTSIAFSLELYWLVFNQVMETRTDLFARILALYFPADHSWRMPGNPPEKALSISLEMVNVFHHSMAVVWTDLVHHQTASISLPSATSYRNLYVVLWHLHLLQRCPCLGLRDVRV